MKPNQNFLLAMLLSFAVIWAWQYFYVQPHNEAYKRAHLVQLHKPTATIKLSKFTEADRNISINNNSRIKIDTAELSGTINMQGANFDDLSLKNYHQTVDKNSPPINLLAPDGTANSYVAKFGFKTIPNSSLWQITSTNKILTAQNPVIVELKTKNGLVFERKISLDSKFMFTIQDKITNNNNVAVALEPYAIVARRDASHNKANYLLHEGLIGVFGQQGLQEKTYNDIKKSGKTLNFDPATGGFIGITDKYWAVTAIPPQNINFTPSFSYDINSNQHFQATMEESLLTIAPHSSVLLNNMLFAGAKNVQTINAYQDQLHIKKFGLLIDWGIFSLITKPMFFLLDYLYKLTGNFGAAILLVTIILKVALFPLAHKSYESMAKMRLLQPKLASIKERYADDKVKLQQATIELYKKEKINPAAGCLPLFIQMPIFFALYKVLYITIEMRHAPFFGWIKDLAAPDPTSVFNLFGLLPYHVPHFLMIGAWPIIMGFTMFLQMKLNPTPTDPTQAKIFTWMPLIFTFTLASFPVGLVIYWAWNNILTIIQQIIIMKKQNQHA